MEAHQQPDSGRPYRSNLAGVWQSTLPDNPRLAAASLYHTLGPRRKSSISQESWATDTFMNSEEGNSLDMVHWAELNPPRSAPATTASQYQVIVPPIASERLGTRVEFTQRFHKTSPNAPKRAARSLLPELHRMPPPQTASRSNLSTPTISTAEEIRLLGSYGRHDAEAVPISRPITRTSTQLKLDNPRGPRPQNNLSRQSQQAGSRPNQAATTKSRGRIQNQLQTETRRGGNVGAMPHSTLLDDNFAVPAAKRQKTERYSSSPSSCRSEDEILDRLGSSNVSWISTQLVSRAPSTHSQEAPLPMKRAGSSTGSLTEHKSVERMMNSDPVTKKQARRANNRRQQHGQGLLLTLPRSLSASQPIDISGEDNEDIMDFEETPLTLPKSRYQGTARLYPSKREVANTSRSIQTGDSQHKSPYFSNNTSVGNQIENTRNHDLARVEPSGRISDEPDSLAALFVPESGERRGSSFNLSSDRDELDQTGNTVRPLADARPSSPSKKSRQNSPSKQNHSLQKPASDDEERSGMDLSNIKPSIWLGHAPKANNDVRAVRARSSKREADPPLGFGLVAIRVGDTFLEKSDFGLVYDAIDDIFRVQINGTYVKVSSTSLTVDPKKLLKVDFGNSGGKVRFTFSKCGHQDNTLDLQFRNEKDVKDIITRLSSGCSFKIMSHESTHMNKVFETRRVEFSRKSNTNDSVIPLLQEVQIPGIGNSAPGTGDVKIQRKSGRLVDELVARAHQNDDSAVSVSSERSKQSANAESGKHHGLFKQPEHNSHLRRSSRMSVATSKVPKDPIEAYPDVAGGFHDDIRDDLPLYEKFSQKHGLGDEWKKPLVYPKAGKKKTTVDFADLERLDEGEFLNDNLIGFYLRYLEQTFGEQKPDLAKRVYFFNTYFYTTLTNAHKPKKSFNYEGVQKWTRAVDIFTYDYIIVPICENTHWYLAIICNLPHLDRVAMPEEVSSPQTELASSRTTEEQNEFAAPLSSPFDGRNRSDTRTLGGDEKEPAERETRNSFAEMSLDRDGGKPTTKSATVETTVITETMNAHADDKEMLDAQFEATMPEDTVEMTFDGPLRETAKQKIEENENITGDPDQSAKANAKTKKQKRKSTLPPVAHSDPSKPAIITFDSLGQTRSMTLKTLKQYLIEEAKTKRGGMEVDTAQIKGINAKVPQQENFSDCGLFLLGYVSKFLEDDPKVFIAKIIGREYTPKEDWSNLNPSTMRTAIRNQVQGLYKIQKDEERQSATKAGKIKGNQVTQASPTPGGRSKAINKDCQKQEAEQDRAGKGENTSTGKSTPQSIPDPPNPTMDMTDDLMVQLTRAATYFGEGSKGAPLSTLANPKQSEDVPFDSECALQIPAVAVDYQHRTGAARQRKPLAELSPIEAKEASIIEIESQSQQDIQLPQSTRHSQLSPEKRDPSELPSEVPDSQPSDATFPIAQVAAPEAPVTSPKRKALGTRSDRSTRRKTTANGLKSVGAEVIDIDD